MIWRTGCGSRVNNSCCFPRIFFILLTLCDFLNQIQCIVFNAFWWIYWPWSFLMDLQPHAVLAPWRCCTKEIHALTTIPWRITSFNSSWTFCLAKFFCCTWFLPWKKEERTNLPIPSQSCRLLTSLLSHLTLRLQKPSLCNHPEACGSTSQPSGQQVCDWERSRTQAQSPA